MPWTRSLSPLVLPLLLAASACGSTDNEGPRTDPTGVESEQEPTTGFDPPPPPDGYTRIVAPVMTGLEPGSDVSHCQYVTAPSDHDIDILDLRGYQSEGGHHSVAYSTTMTAPVGQSLVCDEGDNLIGGFLGGLGGEAGSGAPLPEGVAFRLPAGSAIMLNTHFLNTTDKTIDGETVLDILFAEVEPDRKIASLFSNGSLDFQVPPGGESDYVAACTMPIDMEFIMFSNHMHDYGTSAVTEVVRAGGGEPELVHADPEWSYEMQFNADFTRWDIGAPLTVKAGDTLRTRCTWQNAGDQTLAFPREMCFGIGFFISDGSTSPVCLDGAWLDRGINE
jgi:hypothetical protein